MTQAQKQFQKQTISPTSWLPPLPIFGGKNLVGRIFWWSFSVNSSLSPSPTTYSLTMGQGESTPLSLMTDHFSDVRARAHNLSLLVKKSKLITFCSAVWPTFRVGWPLEGTFQPSIIQAVKEKIMAPDPWGHRVRSPMSWSGRI